jgi:hypothetical protein
MCDVPQHVLRIYFCYSDDAVYFDNLYAILASSDAIYFYGGFLVSLYSILFYFISVNYEAFKYESTMSCC